MRPQVQTELGSNLGRPPKVWLQSVRISHEELRSQRGSEDTGRQCRHDPRASDLTLSKRCDDTKMRQVGCGSYIHAGCVIVTQLSAAPTGLMAVSLSGPTRHALILFFILFFKKIRPWRVGTAQRRGKRWACPKGTRRRHGADAGSLSRFLPPDNVPRPEKIRRLPPSSVAEDREGGKGDRQLDQGRADGQ